MNIPAFPKPKLMQQVVSFDQEDGMTLRDYFAAKALHYALKNSFSIAGAVEKAYEIADAMLEEREQ